MPEEKYVIGRTDKIDIPDFGIKNISVKIDTGAYTCALHCVDPKVISEGGVQKLSFRIIDPLHNEVVEKEFVLEKYRETEIKSSNGVVEKRFVINTEVLIFDKLIETEFSLSNRATMKHPVLLGRKFLQDHFIVDVSKFNLSFKTKRKLSRQKKV